MQKISNPQNRQEAIPKISKSTNIEKRKIKSSRNLKNLEIVKLEQTRKSNTPRCFHFARKNYFLHCATYHTQNNTKRTIRQHTITHTITWHKQVISKHDTACPAYNTQHHTTPSTQHATHDTQHTTFKIQHTTYNRQHTTHKTTQHRAHNRWDTTHVTHTHTTHTTHTIADPKSEIRRQFVIITSITTLKKRHD